MTETTHAIAEESDSVAKAVCRAGGRRGGHALFHAFLPKPAGTAAISTKAAAESQAPLAGRPDGGLRCPPASTAEIAPVAD